LNNVAVTGHFSNTGDFDFSPGIANIISNDGFDIFLSKYDADGNYLWAHNLGGEGTDEGDDLAFDLDGNIYLTGFFNNSVDFDPGPANNTVISNGGVDFFLAKYNPTGEHVWAYGFGSSDREWVEALTVDQNNHVYITGQFRGTLDFDPGVEISELQANGYGDVFMVRYDPAGNLVSAVNLGGDAHDRGINLTTDQANNVYITGDYRGEIDVDPGGK